ncbi:FxsA family protein [Pseudoalteromonas byunsanensis]|uniref:F exclusion suppressor n=1 Tax=Pseudoalteromonas byunsanensis TaxID=327939 RepID=A0A1S1N4W0_9GAMM|nr:FxsA family protein [Pseudoalteromonas byunsanensis]OHU96252.1 F exclusion suppressor [Pseudoalteromonas byunsanensis]
MFRILFVLFVVVPIIEIALLIQVSDVIGGFATIALVILTAILGAKLVKQQGLSAYSDVQGQMARGQMPASELFTGLCVIIAGVLLMTPGIMTDVLGFMLLTPAIRSILAKALMKKMTVKMHTTMQHSQNAYTEHEQAEPFEHKEQQSNNRPSNTIEGEYERKD